MTETFLVETPDGRLCQKTAEELQPEDRHVLGDPGAFDPACEAQAWLDAQMFSTAVGSPPKEIAEAGQPMLVRIQ